MQDSELNSLKNLVSKTVSEHRGSSDANIVDIVFDNFEDVLPFSEVRDTVLEILKNRESIEEEFSESVDDLSFIDFEAFSLNEEDTDVTNNTVLAIGNSNPARSLNTNLNIFTQSDSTPTVGDKLTPLQELMKEGRISPNEVLYPLEKGFTKTALLTDGGNILFEGKVFRSPTKAAKAAGYSLSVKASYRKNGWQFWGVKNSLGELKSLSDVRRSKWVDEI